MARVVAVDDTPEILGLLTAELTAAGLEVDTADTGAAGLELIREIQPDVVLLDIMMPVMDGFEVLECLQDDPDLEDIPVILLSTMDDEHSVVRGLDLGAFDYAVKPFNLAILLARVRTAIRVKRNHDTIQVINLDLREARRAAEAASESKSTFLANMSHEIRTPLSAILGYTELLHEPSLETKLRLEYARVIHNNGDHLLSVLNDILDVSKIEAGKMTIESMPCSPFELAEQVVSLQQAAARRKGLEFTVDYEGALPGAICTDPTRVRQVLLNLISNAIKFTAAGSVTLRACFAGAMDTAGGVLRFEVTDTGTGLTDVQRGNLFEAFTQADVTVSREHGGTGLGLTLCKHFAELLGGQITVHSRVGQGSTFVLTLPTGDLSYTEALTVFEYRRRIDPAPAARPDIPDLTGRVLLAEDSPDGQRLVSLILRKLGLQVQVAGNGREAVDRALAAGSGENGFDLILMDMQMPEMDGVAATVALRAQGYQRPIVALTANAGSAERDRCLAVGFDDFASKPIRRAALAEVVARHLGQVSGAAAGNRRINQG